jgi:hypothetical protein
MNLPEFKAWFEGFSEGIDKTPTAKQWAKINEKIAAIKAEPTKIEYIREYYDRYRPYWGYPTWGGAGVAYALAGGGLQLQNCAAGAAAAPDWSGIVAGSTADAEKDFGFSAEAFKAMGRADIDNLNS